MVSQEMPYRWAKHAQEKCISIQWMLEVPVDHIDMMEVDQGQ